MCHLRARDISSSPPGPIMGRAPVTRWHSFLPPYPPDKIKQPVSSIGSGGAVGIGCGVGSGSGGGAAVGVGVGVGAVAVAVVDGLAGRDVLQAGEARGAGGAGWVSCGEPLTPWEVQASVDDATFHRYLHFGLKVRTVTPPPLVTAEGGA